MSWDNVKIESSNSSDFLKFKDGDNRFRIVSEPVERKVHFDKQNKPHDCEGADCDMCRMGVRRKQGWLFNCIDRADGKGKLVELGVSVMSALKKLRESEDWNFEDMPHYDLTVNRKGTGLETEYMLTPNFPKPLTPKEEEIVAAMKPIEEAIKGKDADRLPPPPKRTAPTEDIDPESIQY
jgi:hypothetical protein